MRLESVSMTRDLNFVFAALEACLRKKSVDSSLATGRNFLLKKSDSFSCVAVINFGEILDKETVSKASERLLARSLRLSNWRKKHWIWQIWKYWYLHSSVNTCYSQTLQFPAFSPPLFVYQIHSLHILLEWTKKQHHRWFTVSVSQHLHDVLLTLTNSIQQRHFDLLHTKKINYRSSQFSFHLSVQIISYLQMWLVLRIYGNVLFTKKLL